ncbi:MAG TPA: hypothetical protein VLG28_13225 [Acidimicrobiia bacterium]|jgi:hypothetical protein|nr:hypothetical protein [Acidimicrobiia bacterium]
MLAFHQNWFYVAVVATGLVGVWGLVLAAMKREPDRTFGFAVAGATVIMLVQVGAGLWLWGQGSRPGDGFHVFYGVVITITFTLAYLYRSTMARRPALSYGLLLLFVMGLGLRAWANVG